MTSSYMGAMGVPGPIGMYGRSYRNRGGCSRTGGMDSYDESHSLLMELSTQVIFAPPPSSVCAWFSMYFSMYLIFL
jgi:hypothetical protein